MKKLMIMSLGAGALLFTACDSNQTRTARETATANKAIEESSTTASGGMDGMNNAQMNNESIYRDQASKASTHLGTDLQLIDENRIQAEEIFFNRAQRRADLPQRYRTDTTGMASEMRNIDIETDRQFREILTEDQYRKYEESLENYADHDNDELNRSEANRQGGLDAGTGTGTRTETQTQGTGGDDK